MFARVLNTPLQKQPPELFYKKSVLKNFAKFTRKHLCQSLFFNKVAGLRPKRETLAQVFSCEFSEIFKNTFFTEHHQATPSASTDVELAFIHCLELS